MHSNVLYENLKYVKTEILHQEIDLKLNLLNILIDVHLDKYGTSRQLRQKVDVFNLIFDISTCLLSSGM